MVASCDICGMPTFYRLGVMSLCKMHGDDHKRKQEKVKVPDNIRMVWTYWDGQQRCYLYNHEDIPRPWQSEAEHVRVRVFIEYKGRILKCERIG